MRNIILSLVFTSAFGHIVFSQAEHSDGKVVKGVASNDMIIYGSDTCHYCTDTKMFLEEKHIKFIYYDVDVNLEKQKEMLEKLQKAGIPLDAISLPVVDLIGKLKMNNVANFEGFLKSLIQKTK
ncbi:glutaredoxin family protein [Seonamhaeicola aphaedonensis]|uniref:Glutaredoxin n=1 Tax=Seonamhaeicola aphaedonensis TaxID=1461338 RepID=A0A3D9HGV4_9FLAO|nr:glutaredoxin domain-containing protein [Seonamhaeicola aphaedonensis]RED48700.1 glutaredoxin [Seonamhaeicola aphaedonensis]